MVNDQPNSIKGRMKAWVGKEVHYKLYKVSNGRRWLASECKPAIYKQRNQSVLKSLPFLVVAAVQTTDAHTSQIKLLCLADGGIEI